MIFYKNSGGSKYWKSYKLALPSLDGKLERFVTKKWKKRLANSSQTDYSAQIIGPGTQQFLVGAVRHSFSPGDTDCHTYFSSPSKSPNPNTNGPSRISLTCDRRIQFTNRFTHGLTSLSETVLLF